MLALVPDAAAAGLDKSGYLARRLTDGDVEYLGRLVRSSCTAFAAPTTAKRPP